MDSITVLASIMLRKYSETSSEEEILSLPSLMTMMMIFFHPSEVLEASECEEQDSNKDNRNKDSNRGKETISLAVDLMSLAEEALVVSEQ